MAIIGGLLVALFYGSGDFFGGLAAKRTRAVTVVIGSFTISAILLVLVTLGWGIFGNLPTPEANDLLLGLAVGVVGPMSLGLLYHGLATGRMSVVAPITAVVAAIVPLAWGIWSGERPDPIALVGVAVALVSVVLISGAPPHDDHPVDAATPSARAVAPSAVASGVGFGVIFVLLGSTSSTAGLWPLMVSRPTSVVLTVTAVLVWSATRGHHDGRAMLRPTRGALPFIAAAGVLDITANATFLAAANAGLLSIVAVLSSLYPAATVVLARVFLGERLHRVQVWGLVLALAGIAAMTL